VSPAQVEAAAWPHVHLPGDPDKPVLLMLHGTGGNEEQIARFGTELYPGAEIIAPRGPVTEDGMLRWFRRHAEGVFDVDDVVARSAQLAGFIHHARRRYQLEDRPLVAVGFSNGANIALATALLNPVALDRVIALSGMYPLGDRGCVVSLAGTQVLVLNGDQDPMAPLASVDTLVATLRGQGANVEQVVRPGGHGIEAADLQAARDWLARNA
jgi:phospholipase/carboxylesterase